MLEQYAVQDDQNFAKPKPLNHEPTSQSSRSPFAPDHNKNCSNHHLTVRVIGDSGSEILHVS